MNFDEVKIVSSFADNPDVVEVRQQIRGYAIAELRPGAKIRAVFAETAYYLLVSDQPIKMFCNNEYYAAVLVEHCLRNNGMELRYMYIRSRAVVFSDIGGEHKISPVGNNSDLFWGIETKRQSFLRKHFERVYHGLYESDPVGFEENFSKLKAMNLNFEFIDGHLVF